MSFWIMLIIMAITGTIGGIVNYLLPANNPEPGKFLSPPRNCILLGLGATLLVPLFLEIAQSKLMDDIRFDSKWSASAKEILLTVKDTMKIVNITDTSKKIRSDTTMLKGKKTKEGESASSNTGKNYLLRAAYCLLAAAAGLKFINMLINNVVKEEQLNKEKNKNEELEKEKEKRTKNSQISQEKEDRNMGKELTKDAINTLINDNNTIEVPVLPSLVTVIHPEDPQKGRFGGKSENNERKLSAKVTASTVPDFYHVQLTVESTNVANLINTDVIFYIHDSFSPSVFT